MIIIGDVHGCYKTLMALLKQLPKDEEIIITGDLIDRGPNSKDVIQFMIDNPHIKCVMGNHEMMFLNFIDCKYQAKQLFYYNGGDKTVKSYGSLEDIPKEHIEYIRNLPKTIKVGNLVVSHSGCKEDPWDRNNFEFNLVDKHLEDGEFHVFGHTPLAKVLKTDRWANIDTGCVFKNYGGFLSAISYPNYKEYKQENIEDEELNL